MTSRFDTLFNYFFELADIYISKHVSLGSAALSYFLTLSLFPLLICINAMLALFSADISIMLEGLNTVLPAGALETINDYLKYVSGMNSSAILSAGIIAMATTSAAAYRIVSRIMADIQGEPRYKGILNLIFSFLFSFLLLFAIFLSIAVVLAGNWLIELISEWFPEIVRYGFVVWLRYPILFFIMVFVILGIYMVTAPRNVKKVFFPGAISASVAIVLISIIFSWLIGQSARYPLIYGSLASIIIYMAWVNICGQLLIMGNALNVVIRRHKGTDNGKLKKSAES